MCNGAWACVLHAKRRKDISTCLKQPTLGNYYEHSGWTPHWSKTRGLLAQLASEWARAIVLKKARKNHGPTEESWDRYSTHAPQDPTSSTCSVYSQDSYVHLDNLIGRQPDEYSDIYDRQSLRGYVWAGNARYSMDTLTQTGAEKTQ